MNPPESDLDPVERYIPLLLKLGLYAVHTFLFTQAVTTFISYQPGQSWPAFLGVLRTFTFLPLHEGGHFLFMFFGRTLHILGGSFWQIMFPLLWFVIALRQRSQAAPFALFWVGENMMDVSLYIRDAAYRALPLLGGHSSGHDWVNLLTEWNAMDSAEPLADVVYYLGVCISAGAILAGIVWAIARFIHPPAVVFEESSESVGEMLEEKIENREKREPLE
jgi:hypothetical protein